MGVSKQDWKNFESNIWVGGQVKPALDELTQEFNALYGAIDGDDTATFLSYTESDGKLMQAAQKASSAASSAVQGVRDVELKGSQRRFANKNAIATSDAAIASVEQYHMACDLLVTGLVRGVQLEHDRVAEDQAQMATMKSGDLKERLQSEERRIKACYDDATVKVAALATIDKIGVV